MDAKCDLQALFGTQFGTVRDFSPDSKEYLSGLTIETLVTECIYKLGQNSYLNNVQINELMQLLWKLVGNLVTPMAGNSNIPSIHFACLTSVHKIPQAMIMLPLDWVEKFHTNPTLQFGGLVFVASQARDFYNGKFTPPDVADRATFHVGVEFMKSGIMARAQAYEAEYLNTVLQIEGPAPVLDDYQKFVLSRYPKGLESLPDIFRYESYPFDFAYAFAQGLVWEHLLEQRNRSQAETLH